MPDQYRLVPYGDAFLVQTPTLDSVAKQLYVTQQQRQLRQQQENQALDQMFQKEFANIRSVDTPDVVNSYNRYKQLKKNLLFNKDLQRDPMAYNQAQQAANEAFSNMNQQINQSREVKDMVKTMTSDRFKNPDAYADDYGQRVMALNSTPVSGLGATPDLVNWDNYRYQGSNTNFNDIVSKVYGQNRKIVGPEEALDKQGIQFRSPVYEYGTPPGQVYEGLINSLDHKTERDAAYKWKQLTPEVVQGIEKQYNSIPQTKWEQMGLTGPQKIDLRGGSDAEKYMRLLAMQNAVNTSPRLVNYENRTSEKAKMDLQYARDKEMAALKQKNAKELIQYKKDIDPNDKDLNDLWVTTYVGKLKDEALSKSPSPYKYSSGATKQEYDIPVDPVLGKALSVGNVEPDAVRVDKDGKFRRVFYKRYQKGDVMPAGKSEGDIITTGNGNAAVDETLSRPQLTQDQIELALGKRALTGKQLNKQMVNTVNESPVSGKKYSFNGKSYSKKQLNDLGYDDNEIDQAINAGIIK